MQVGNGHFLVVENKIKAHRFFAMPLMLRLKSDKWWKHSGIGEIDRDLVYKLKWLTDNWLWDHIRANAMWWRTKNNGEERERERER